MNFARNILAVIGLLAVVLGGVTWSQMPSGMPKLAMAMMSSPEMKPMLDGMGSHTDQLMAAARNLEEGAAETGADLMTRWAEGEGDIAVATTWARKVEDGITPEDIQLTLESKAAEWGLKAVGTLPLSDELLARGMDSKYMKVYSFCNPVTARHMVSFSPHMSAFLPCRIVVVEQEDGLWLYTLNMDMMVKMGQQLPPELKKEATKVRDTIWDMMQSAATGGF